jgi:hypothetical protein
VGEDDVSDEVSEAMIREATSDDYPLFLRLWMAFIEDQHSQGGDIRVTPKNVQFFSLLFGAYTQGLRKGVVLIGGNNWGISMWGEDLADPMLESKYAPFARGWGTYIESDHRREGLGNALREYGRDCMRKMGFKYIGGNLLATNGVSIDSLKKYSTETPSIFYFMSLEDK